MIEFDVFVTRVSLLMVEENRIIVEHVQQLLRIPCIIVKYININFIHDVYRQFRDGHNSSDVIDRQNQIINIRICGSINQANDKFMGLCYF